VATGAKPIAKYEYPAIASRINAVRNPKINFIRM
jgi:hypothetical protein